MEHGNDLMAVSKPRRPWVIAVVTAPALSVAGALVALWLDFNNLSLVGAYAVALVVSVLGTTAVAYGRGLPRRELPLWALLTALTTIGWMVPGFLALFVIGCWGNEHCMS
jgi:hypothetical protein